MSKSNNGIVLCITQDIYTDSANTSPLAPTAFQKHPQFYLQIPSNPNPHFLSMSRRIRPNPQRRGWLLEEADESKESESPSHEDPGTPSLAQSPEAENVGDNESIGVTYLIFEKRY